MARTADSPPAEGLPFPRPWGLLLVGMLLALVGLLLSYSSWDVFRLLLLGLGMLVGGVAVLRKFQTTGWEFEQRVETSAFLALTGFLALIGYMGMDEKWDSGKVFFAGAVVVALGGAGLVLLSSVIRKTILVILVFIHFGGMMTAVTSVAPPNSTAPWVSVQMWRLYRPYLTMIYMANAYHFYSPDPGPATLVWFRVAYEDGSARWVFIPDKEKSPVRMHYQRMLALTESTNNPMHRLPLTVHERSVLEREVRKKIPGYQMPGYSWETILQRRDVGAATRELPKVEELIRVGYSLNFQYREPQEMAKRLISSYARYVAQNTPHSEDPTLKVKNVKVYRLVHTVITPAGLAEQRNPYEKTRYWPYFQGEFDAQGNMINSDDPFLYWYVPVVVVHKDWPRRREIYPVVDPPPFARVLDGLAIHSGDQVFVKKDKLQ
jgi:hypothetical protein